MISKVKHLAAALLVVVPLATVGAGCDNKDYGRMANERWVTTENTNVTIDWDKVNEAYKLAEGPEDLERRINEIYEGDEVISIAVLDQDASTQVVTGFFDKNKSGNIDEGEKIFTIQRDVTGEGAGQYQTVGYGHYAGYHSPFMSIASGMMMGAMMSHMFMPSYVPVYTQPYTTSAARAGAIHQTRSGYRAANPQKFQKSRSGKSYGSPSQKGRSSGGMKSGGGRSGGGRFGLARAGRAVRPALLSA